MIKMRITEVIKLILVLNLIVIFSLPFNEKIIAGDIRKIVTGFYVANFFVLFIFFIKNKPEVAIEFIIDLFRIKDGILSLFIQISALIFLLFLCLLFLVIGFYILDYEFVKEGFDYFSINHNWLPKPDFLLKSSFIITSAVLSYCYSNCKG